MSHEASHPLPERQVVVGRGRSTPFYFLRNQTREPLLTQPSSSLNMFPYTQPPPNLITTTPTNPVYSFPIYAPVLVEAPSTTSTSTTTTTTLFLTILVLLKASSNSPWAPTGRPTPHATSSVFCVTACKPPVSTLIRVCLTGASGGGGGGGGGGASRRSPGPRASRQHTALGTWPVNKAWRFIPGTEEPSVGFPAAALIRVCQVDM